MMTDISVRQAQLKALRADLLGRLRTIDDTLYTEKPKDDEDRAIETEDTEVLERLGQEGLHELKMIDAALKRIEDETYGVCANCGNPINEERLNILPFTPLCRICAREADETAP